MSQLSFECDMMCQQMQSEEAKSPSADASNDVRIVVSDCGVQVQLETWNNEMHEELQQLREEVKMLRTKYRHSSGMML